MFTLHGTFLKILGQGVLIKGQSSSGKSVLSLELIHRGHQLIADDAVWFEKKQQKILGKCPPQIQNFMYVKEFGIMNILKMFGADAISLYTELKLVIQLSPTKNRSAWLSDCDTSTAFQAEMRHTQDRNVARPSMQQNCSLKHKEDKVTSILGVNIPTVTLPARCVPPILVEIAVRDLLLKAKGYFALDEFNHQHQQFMHAYQTKNHDS